MDIFLDILLKPPQPFIGLFLTIKTVCKFLKSFTIPIFSKVEITTDFNGQQSQLYYSNTQKWNGESFSNFTKLFL